MRASIRKSQVQGEGDYEAGRRHDKAAREFAQSGRVVEVGRKAKPRGAREAAEMDDAQRIGKARIKREDPGDRW